jgi:ribokinase
LGWDDLAEMDCVFFTAGDEAAVHAARKARVLVATSRAIHLLAKTHVELDALVGSSTDPAEAYSPGDLDPPPRVVVWTAGSNGGTWSLNEDGEVHGFPAPPLPGPIVDRYGAGDSFAGGLTYALGAGYPAERAVALAARCGVAVLTGRGPFDGQLEAEPKLDP